MKFLENKIIKTAVVIRKMFSAKSIPSVLRWLALGGVIAFALLLLIEPNQTQASLFDFGYWVVGKVATGISFIVSFIAGIAIAIEAWFIEIILKMNTQIVNSAPVRTGFPIALSIANLGFVLAIIVMAIATILRLQGYMMKQILWKLVVAALLVNFSLVFAGAILNIADQLTLYFINQMSPGGVGETQKFANAIAGAFNPQKLLLVTDGELNPSKVKDFEKEVGGAGGSFAVDNESLGKMLVPIASLVFTGLSMIVIVIALLGLIIMLLIRYVFIGILLILMPFAWLTWIFPGLSSNWSKWWKNFIKWSLFAPLVVFFLYLGVQTSLQAHNDIGQYEVASQTSGTGPWAAVAGFFSRLLTPIVSIILQQIIVLAVMVGGLFAANSLGIMAAHGTLGAVKGASKGLGKWAGAKAGGGLARFATQKGPAPLPQPKGWGPKAMWQRATNPVKKLTRKVTTPVGKPFRAAAGYATKAILPEQAYSAIAKFGRESQKVTLGGAIFAGIGKGSGLWGKKKVKTKFTKKEKAEFLKKYSLTEDQFDEMGYEMEEERGGGGETPHTEEPSTPKIEVVGTRGSVRETQHY